MQTISPADHEAPADDATPMQRRADRRLLAGALAVAFTAGVIAAGGLYLVGAADHTPEGERIAEVDDTTTTAPVDDTTTVPAPVAVDQPTPVAPAPSPAAATPAPPAPSSIEDQVTNHEQRITAIEDAPEAPPAPETTSPTIGVVPTTALPADPGEGECCG